MKNFVLIVTYGTGRTTMVTDTPDLREALSQFVAVVGRGIPDTKDYGIPPILSAEILPLLHESPYKLSEAK